MFFFAQGCGDCKAQAPSLTRVWQKYKSSGLALITATRLYGSLDDKPATPEEETARIETVWKDLYAGLDGTRTSDQISAFSHELARALEADHPDLVVSDMKKSVRTGKVLLDWSQNNGSKTTIVPYSLRGRAQPTVAAPRTWRELAAPSLAQLDHAEVLRRLAKRGDPLAELSASHPPR